MQPFKYSGTEIETRHGIGWYDFGARRYDHDLARWTTMDPLSEKYYSVSPYVFCNNNPVNFVDLDGKKIYFAAGVSDTFKQKFAETIQFMNSKGTAVDLATLHESDIVYYIAEIKEEDLIRGGNNSNFDYIEKTIYWDYTHFAQTKTGVLLSPATVLAHEAAHAVRYDQAVKNGSLNQWKANAKKKTDAKYGTIEERIVITITEQEAALKHGEIEQGQVTRTDHGGQRCYLIVADSAPEDISQTAYEYNSLLK